ncbi:unnamed protein product [Rotaria sordida]|uniref:Uncharacterized protein n=1 Tax=Rotaria sordida TaxID=392033 RepID=A0A815QGG4_9BILA|nr:unnamed protein product [Rotaria sordida]CAF1192701.1 unnamed protein product [Rotaria sordida]CAF1250124.1 unnamed protein product [Rotaria sordida]CAF1352369.1 unnamed protein product [Rotaria sordida]CAF1462895.1 unnamed protein product [Rotaria sordida]
MQLFIIIILVVSLGFALIGITTNYWYQSLSNEFNEGLWVICHRQSTLSYSSLNIDSCHKQPYFKSQGLAVSALVILSISLILSTIRRYRKNDPILVYLTILLLIISIILSIFSYLLHPRDLNVNQFGYSIYFMLISNILSFITTGLLIFSAIMIQPS